MVLELRLCASVVGAWVQSLVWEVMHAMQCIQKKTKRKESSYAILISCCFFLNRFFFFGFFFLGIPIWGFVNCCPLDS